MPSTRRYWYARPEMDSLEARLFLTVAGPVVPEPLYAAPVGLGVQTAIMSDMDGDGHADAITVAWDTVAVRRYDGHGGFLPAQVASVPAAAEAFANVRYPRIFSADYDGDGDNDLVLVALLNGVHGRFYERTWLLTNDGDGNLSLASIIKSSSPLYNINVQKQIDVDGDGGAEFIGNDTSHVYGFVNGALVDKGDFGPEFLYGTPTDFDGDGDTDLLGLRVPPGYYATSATIVLRRNNGSAGYSTETLFSASLPEIHGFTYGDVTGDGVKDLLLYGSDLLAAGSPTLNVYAVPRVSGVFTLEPTPIYSEAWSSIRIRGGHPGALPGSYYVYSAVVSDVVVGANVGGDVRPDITFTIVSRQIWTYRLTGPLDTFEERYSVALIATDPVGGNWLPTFAAQPYTPLPSLPNTTPTPPWALASGDIDGDGEKDYIVGRGDAGRGDGWRLAYVQLSSAHLPVVKAVTLYVNGAQTPGVTLRQGDNLQAGINVRPYAPGETMQPAKLFIDSNNNGVLDASDLLLQVGHSEPVPAGAQVSVYTFDVTREASWGGTGVRTLFFVPFDGNGRAGVPLTWMANLV